MACFARSGMCIFIASTTAIWLYMTLDDQGFSPALLMNFIIED